MNGRAAKKLRRAFGTGAAYKNAKKQYDTYPTRFAQGTLTMPKRAPAGVSEGEGLGGRA